MKKKAKELSKLFNRKGATKIDKKYSAPPFKVKKAKKKS